jgi:hypothetical protein
MVWVTLTGWVLIIVGGFLTVRPHNQTTYRHTGCGGTDKSAAKR